MAAERALKKNQAEMDDLGRSATTYKGHLARCAETGRKATETWIAKAVAASPALLADYIEYKTEVQDTYGKVVEVYTKLL
jgi:hypothetical protein